MCKNIFSQPSHLESAYHTLHQELNLIKQELALISDIEKTYFLFTFLLLKL